MPVTVDLADRLMVSALDGQLSKHQLASYLTADAREGFLNACAAIERQYTEACTTKRDPCLESGCAVEDAEGICLQPILRAGDQFHKDCAAEWVKWFRDPANRAD